MRERAPAAADLEHVIRRAELERARTPAGACAAARRRAARRASLEDRARVRHRLVEEQLGRGRCRGRSGTRCSGARRAVRCGGSAAAARPRADARPGAAPRPRSTLRSSSSSSRARSSESPLARLVRLAERELRAASRCGGRSAQSSDLDARAPARTRSAARSRRAAATTSVPPSIPGSTRSSTAIATRPSAVSRRCGGARQVCARRCSRAHRALPRLERRLVVERDPARARASAPASG